MEYKMDNSAASSSSSPVDPGAPPAKIPVGRVFEFDKNVSYEDILAARVFRKALGAQAFVFFLIIGVLAYVGFDLKSKSAELDKAQAALNLRQETLRRNMDSASLP